MDLQKHFPDAETEFWCTVACHAHNKWLFFLKLWRRKGIGVQARRRNRVGRRVGGWAWEEEPYEIGDNIVLWVIFNIDAMWVYVGE